jgi:threonine dehydrogenase-like Zn-dependent dehydrogenase
MRATLIHGARDIRVDEVPDPGLHQPTDALVRVVAACICGSDLWPYRGIAPTPAPRRIGHEFVGVVEETGPEVRTVRPGDFVIAPFLFSDNTCANCRNGVQTSCLSGGGWGAEDHGGAPVDGGQGQWVRVPLADGTLVATPESPDPGQLPGLLALSDVMGTGHHAARAARVGPGSTVAVVGDGAVGLCAVLAAVRLGAERVVAMSRHADRQQMAKAFGATDVVEQRGEQGAERIRDMFDGVGADCVLECVGTEESMSQALASVRPGGNVGYVGVPFGAELSIRTMFRGNIGVGGGVAPVREYLPELLADTLTGRIDPGRVFDLELPLERIAEGYEAMDERRSIKTLIRP